MKEGNSKRKKGCEKKLGEGGRVVDVWRNTALLQQGEAAHELQGLRPWMRIKPLTWAYWPQLKLKMKNYVLNREEYNLDTRRERRTC